MRPLLLPAMLALVLEGCASLSGPGRSPPTKAELTAYIRRHWTDADQGFRNFEAQFGIWADKPDQPAEFLSLDHLRCDRPAMWSTCHLQVRGRFTATGETKDVEMDMDFQWDGHGWRQIFVIHEVI